MERRGTSTAYGFEARKLTEAATGKCGHLVAVFGLHRHLSLHGPAAGLEAQGARPAFQCAVVDPAVLQHGAEEVTQPPRQRARLRGVRAQRREGAHRRGEQRRQEDAPHFSRRSSRAMVKLGLVAKLGLVVTATTATTVARRETAAWQWWAAATTAVANQRNGTRRSRGRVGTTAAGARRRAGRGAWRRWLVHPVRSFALDALCLTGRRRDGLRQR